MANNSSFAIPLKYQSSIGGNGTGAILYHFNTADADARLNYYSVPYGPSAALDGTFVGDPSSLNTTVLTNAASIPSFFEISASPIITGNNLKIQVSVTPKINSFAKGSIVLQVVVVEDPINLSIPAPNGSTVMRDVMRKMLPNANGTALTSFTANTSFTKTLNYNNISSLLIKQNLHVVVFIQDNETKKVMQVEKFSIGYANIDDKYNIIKDFTVYPNPFSTFASIQFNIAEKENILMEVFNIVGESVYSINKGKCQAGENKFDFDANMLSSGFYYIKITAGNYSSIQKVSIEK